MDMFRLYACTPISKAHNYVHEIHLLTGQTRRENRSSWSTVLPTSLFQEESIHYELRIEPELIISFKCTGRSCKDELYWR